MASVRHRNKANEQTVFPQMTNSEICECLYALGIDIKIEELVKPTAHTAQMVFMALLDALMGVSADYIDGPKNALLGMMEYKDLYGESLHFTMFFRHCRVLAQVCGIHDFTISDLTRPEAGKFRSNLSGVMNFAKFRVDRHDFMLSLQQKVQDQVEKADNLRGQLERIEIDTENIVANQERDRPLTEEAKKRNDAIRSELMQLRSDQLQLSHSVEDLKKERQAVMEQAASKNHQFTTLTASVSAAKSRLVQSPDRIKRHISEMSSTVAAEKASLASFQRKGRELGNRLEVIGGLEVDLRGLIDLERGIDEKRGKVEEVKRSKLKLNAQCEGKTIEADAQRARLDQLGRQLNNAHDKLQRQQEMYEEMQARSKSKVDTLKQEYMTKTKERTALRKQVNRLQAEKEAIDAEMANFIATHESEINDVLQEYWTMRRQAEDYMNTLSMKLDLRIST